MRREQLYLEDVVQACDSIRKFTAGVDLEGFLQSELIRSAVLHKLIVIGEAVSRLPAEVKARYPQVEWVAIAGFRNRLVHGYFAVEWPIVWVAATEEVPALRQQIVDILHAGFGD